MVRELESFARSQPVAFFVCAAAAGFLATRFLKAEPGTGVGPVASAASFGRTPGPPGAGGVIADDRPTPHSSIPGV